MTIGEKIKRYRKALGLTQTELGERLGVKTNAVSKWECGRVEDIPTSKIKAMAALFEVQVSELIDEEKTAAPEDDGLAEYLEMLRSRPECRMLFSVAKDATKADVEKAVAIIEALRKTEESK